MDLSLLFMGILPLAAFAILDSFFSMRAALFGAVILALFEIVFSLHLSGTVDWITWVSVFLVIILALCSWRFDNELYFKLQPAIISLILAAILLVSSWMERPLLLELLEKYGAALSGDMKIPLYDPNYRAMVVKLNHYAGYTILVHGVLSVLITLKFSKWWWLFMRGIAFYIFLLLPFILIKLGV